MSHTKKILALVLPMALAGFVNCGGGGSGRDNGEGGGSSSGGKGGTSAKGGSSGKGGTGGTKSGGSGGAKTGGTTGTGGAKTGGTSAGGSAQGGSAQGGSVGQGGTPPAGTGPIVKFTFDGNTMDTSGNNNHGVAVQGATAAAANHPSPRYAVGKTGMAIEVNGTDEWVRVADSDSLDATGLNNAVSISTWVYINAYTTAKPYNIISQRHEVGTRLEQFGLSLFNGTPTGGVHFFYTSGPQNVPIGEWVHMAFTYDGVTERVYVNGAEATFSDIGWPVAADETPLSIGGGINEEEVIEWMNGRVDDYQLFARELTAAEVATFAGK